MISNVKPYLTMDNKYRKHTQIEVIEHPYLKEILIVSIAAIDMSAVFRYTH